MDWDAARARLRRARATLDRERTPEAERQLLEDRAAALASPPAAEADTGETLDLVVFVLGGQRFAVEARHVLEAVALDHLTPVPGTRASLLGVTNRRGRVLGVMDLRRQLAADAPAGALSHVVAVSVDGMSFGIAAEAVEETTRERAAVGAVTDDLVTVLDLEAMAADPRLRIEDD
jgi:purine-binding chemotaxis protein CheW